MKEDMQLIKGNRFGGWKKYSIQNLQRHRREGKWEEKGRTKDVLSKRMRVRMGKWIQRGCRKFGKSEKIKKGLIQRKKKNLKEGGKRNHRKR